MTSRDPLEGFLDAMRTARSDLGVAGPAPTDPPPGAMTFALFSIEEARRRVGRDAIVRDDPYFGRRGIIKKIIPDATHGFLVAVHVYKRERNERGEWEELHNAPANARKFLAPGRVEVA